MFQDLERYPWVMKTVQYDPDSDGMEAALDAAIQGPESWLEQQHARNQSA
jgi:hypothetical protein